MAATTKKKPWLAFMKMNRLLVRAACYYTNASTRGPSQKVKNWVSTKDRAAREAKRLFSRFVSSAARKVIIFRWIQEQFSREYNVACKENKLPKIQMSIFSLRVYKPRKYAWIFVRGQIRGHYLFREMRTVFLECGSKKLWPLAIRLLKRALLAIKSFISSVMVCSKPIIQNITVTPVESNHSAVYFLLIILALVYRVRIAFEKLGKFSH